MQRIIVELKSSRYLASILLMLYSSSILLLYTLPLISWLKAIVALSLVSIAIQQCRLLAWRITSSAIVAFSHQRSADYWQLQDHQGRAYLAKLQGDSIITSFMLVLNFSSLHHKQPISIIVLPDMLAKANFKKLIAYLRFCI